MGGIKAMVFVGGILAIAGFLYLRSSISTDEATELKASTPVSAPTGQAEAPADEAKSPAPQESETAKAAPVKPESPESATKIDTTPPHFKGAAPDGKFHRDVEFHARERKVARQIWGLCKSGKEKRKEVCEHAHRVLKHSPRPKKKAAAK